MCFEVLLLWLIKRCFFNVLLIVVYRSWIVIGEDSNEFFSNLVHSFVCCCITNFSQLSLCLLELHLTFLLRSIVASEWYQSLGCILRTMANSDGSHHYAISRNHNMEDLWKSQASLEWLPFEGIMIGDYCSRSD